MNFNFKKLPPFKWFVLQNFPFIEADFDAITYYQLLCKLAEEINKVINSNNSIGQQTENLTKAYNELQSYVEHYFDNLNIQEEINNKLDEMAEDGTLENILLDYVLLNNIIELENIEELKNSTVNVNKLVQTQNFYNNDGNGSLFKIVDDNLYVDNINTILLNNGLKAIKLNNFYNYIKPFPIDYTKQDYSILIGFDNDTKAQSYLCKKYNEFLLLKEKAFDNVTNKIDMSLIFHNNEFYCFDDYGKDYKPDIPQGYWYGSNTISFIKSKDFNHWSGRTDIQLPSQFWQAFAPEIFVDTNGDIYCIFIGSIDYTIVNNQFVFKTYIMKALNDNLTAWSNPTIITINDTNLNNQLDPFLIKKDDVYYLFVKDELTKKYRQYQSNSLNNFEFVQEINIDNVEGGEIIFQNGQYNFYVENLTNRFTYVAYSTDLINWSEFEKVNTLYNIPTRHFGFICVNNIELHNFFDNYITQFPLFEEKAQIYNLFNINWDFNSVELKNLSTNNIIDSLKLEKNTIYRISANDNITINNFDISQLKSGNFVGFFIGSDSLNAKITIKPNNHFLYNYGDYIIEKDNRNTLIMFYLYGGTLIPLNNNLIKNVADTQIFLKNGDIITANNDVSFSFDIEKTKDIWNHNLYKLIVDIGDSNSNVLSEFIVKISVDNTTNICNASIINTNNIINQLNSILVNYDNTNNNLQFVINSSSGGKIRYTLMKITNWS